MAQYILRLDDAAPHADWEKWERMEGLLDKYKTRPLVGIIPDCKDMKINKLGERKDFWEKVGIWKEKGWTIAMHGYDHVYITDDGGFNPVNHKSEFAGVPLEIQKEKIRKGVSIFREHGIEPKVFFAPSHTMDMNTIEALKQESKIRIISDTIANSSYRRWGMTFVPQQSGRMRKLPFKVVTFCCHPNMMDEKEFECLEVFFKKHWKDFCDFPLEESDRRETVYDRMLREFYFFRR